MTRRLAPSFFENSTTHQNPLKSVRYEGFAGGLKKKVVVDILVVAFMSAENPQKFGEKVQNDILVVAFMSPENRGRPGLAWLRPLWLPHSLSVASTQTRAKV